MSDDARDVGDSDDDNHDGRIMKLKHKLDDNQIKSQRELWRTGRPYNLHGLRRIHSLSGAACSLQRAVAPGVPS